METTNHQKETPMNVKYTLIALVTGVTVIGCVSTAAQATGPLSATSTAAPLAARVTPQAASGAQSLAGGLARSTAGAQRTSEAGDDGGRATARHPVSGDDVAPRPAVLTGRTATLTQSGAGASAAPGLQDA